MNKAVVGKEYPHVTYELTREMVLAYARAVEDDNPFFNDEDAEVLYAPHTLVVAYTLLLVPHIISDKELDLDLGKPIIHVGQVNKWKRAVKAGDVLTIRGRIAEIRKEEGHEFITFEGDIADEDGESVVLARSTLRVG
ncbi:MAG: MaoC family dehydratase N-terminal domain-containing protein [Actinobacteria bacterium]|nr:MaoC family dehydratase N-terminal domain-containing protein [Actinomycetota bacterium]